MKQPIFIVLLALVIGFGFMAAGQSDPLLRIEIETRDDNAQYRVIPCDSDGFMLIYPTTFEEDEYQFWMAVFYDKFMQEVWKKNIPLFKNMRFRNHYFENDQLYLFHYISGRKRGDLYNFQIARISTTDGGYELFSGVLPDNALSSSFHVFGETIYAGLNLEGEEAGIYTFNLSEREVKPLYEARDNKSRLEHLYIDRDYQSLIALLNIYDSKTNFFMQLNRFALEGSGNEAVNIMPDPGRKFNTGRVIPAGENNYYIFGTYEPIKGETIDPKNYFLKHASGFFVASVREMTEASTRFESFLDLDKMTGYLRSREYQQARRKAERRDGPESVPLSFNMLLHDVILRDSSFFLLAEAYFEEYHTVTSTYYDFYGRTVPFTQTIFDGYRHFNAFLSAYDFSGNKVWDDGMEIFNILSFDLRRRVNIHFVDQNVTLFYNHDGKISSKFITGSDKMEGVMSYPVETTYVNDRIISDSKSDITHWYDNYFIAFGFQTIRNNALPNSRRTVFYMNKVEIR